MKAFVIWSRSIPQPLSVTRIMVIPPSRISTVMAVEPASMEFSTSSLTTLSGRSMTSPAAIRLMVSSGRSLISIDSDFLFFLHHRMSVLRHKHPKEYRSAQTVVKKLRIAPRPGAPAMLQTFAPHPAAAALAALRCSVLMFGRSSNVRKCASQLGICGRSTRCFFTPRSSGF